MAKKGSDVVAIGAVRTAMSNFGGSLKDVAVYDLGKYAIQGVLEKTKLPPGEISEAVVGNCRQAGNGPNAGRTAIRRAGLDASLFAVTINCACPSSMKSTITATQGIIAGDIKVALVVGMESMSTIPYLVKNIRWQGLRSGDHLLQDGWSDGADPFLDSRKPLVMGITAENVARKYGITRKEQDEFALSSHQKAAIAQDNGWFDEEIVPVEVPGKKGKPGTVFNRDESIRRDTSIEKLGSLRPAFMPDGTVTAGNSCGLTDGASAIIVMTRQKAEELGIKPLFKIISYASIGVDNAFMGEGPSVSIPMALKNAGMTLKDIDLIEVNEAFSAQVIANERVLKWDRSKLNIHGGAIALGHPTGCSGVRIMVTGYYALKRLNKEFAVCGICGGGGVSCAVVIQAE